MKAIQCVEWGAPDKLILADLPLPEPGPGQVRIRIAAAGVNFPDALIVQKKYQLQPKLPFVPGTEVAGTVDAVGEGVRHLKPAIGSSPSSASAGLRNTSARRPLWRWRYRTASVTRSQPHSR